MIVPILNNIRVLICRPEPSASELSQVLKSVGANCEVLPTISIQPVALNQKMRSKILDLDNYQKIIVTSQHAAEIGLSYIDEFWPQLPLKQDWYAMGRKTAEKLQALVSTLNAPDMDLTSEGLLSRPELQKINGQKILLLKGEGGRNVIEQTLVKRGAKIESLELYKRTRPEYDKELLNSRLVTFDPDYIIALSGSTLNNLVALCGEANLDLNQRKLILSSKRVANIAFEHGFKLTCIPENLMPIDIIRCIANDYRQSHP